MGKALNEQLVIAVKHGDIQKIKTLVGAGADMSAEDCCGHNALDWAFAYGNEDAAEELIKAGADDSSKKIASFIYYQSVFGDKRFGSLVYAIANGDFELAREMLSCGVDVKSRPPRVKEALALTITNALEGGRLKPVQAKELGVFPGMKLIMIKAVQKYHVDRIKNSKAGKSKKAAKTRKSGGKTH